MNRDEKFNPQKERDTKIKRVFLLNNQKKKN